MSNPRRITAPQFTAFKSQGRKISMVTAYDYTMGALVDAAGVEGVLVGDTLGMVVQGRETTLPVTLDQIIYHAEMVGRAVRQALVVVDLPFPVGHLGAYQAVEAASRILKETTCQAVKLEGGAEQAEVIRALVSGGVPVMAHVGLRPQSIHTMGGYRVQRDAERLLADARAVQEAGAFSIVLECIPDSLAARISRELTIPTIGIGAGPACDGQVLVLNDLLGLTASPPRFVKTYANLQATILAAVKSYREDVASGAFPTEKHSYREK